MIAAADVRSPAAVTDGGSLAAPGATSAAPVPRRAFRVRTLAS